MINEIPQLHPVLECFTPLLRRTKGLSTIFGLAKLALQPHTPRPSNKSPKPERQCPKPMLQCPPRRHRSQPEKLQSFVRKLINPSSLAMGTMYVKNVLILILRLKVQKAKVNLWLKEL